MQWYGAIVPAMQSATGLIPIFGHVIWLHATSGLLACYVGFLMKDEPVMAGAMAGARLSGRRSGVGTSRLSPRRPR